MEIDNPPRGRESIPPTQLFKSRQMVMLGRSSKLSVTWTKHHVSLDRVPYSSISVYLGVRRKPMFQKHPRSYAWHRQRGGSQEEGSMDGLVKSVNPCLVDNEDMEVMGKEEPQ